ncbi:MAG: PEP-CTERM sorting domain-containing protein [Phycisphaerae bacterium]|nr:PEP-CTERM sorting domain-containing protein [Phycisphaerae bacterium]
MKLKKLLGPSVVLAMTAQLAMAGLVSYNDNNAYTGHMGRDAKVKIHFDGSPVNHRTIDAGEMFVGYDATGTGDNYIETAVFCSDVTAYLTGRAYQVTETSPFDFAGERGQKAAWLASNNYSDTMTDAQAAGLQVALWEIIHEDSGNPFSASKGDFRITNVYGNDIISIADSYLESLEGLNDFSGSDGIFLAAEGRQDLLIVPEPVTICLLAAGGAMFLKKRKSSVK